MVAAEKQPDRVVRQYIVRGQDYVSKWRKGEFCSATFVLQVQQWSLRNDEHTQRGTPSAPAPTVITHPVVCAERSDASQSAASATASGGTRASRITLRSA